MTPSQAREQEGHVSSAKPKRVAYRCVQFRSHLLRRKKSDVFSHEGGGNPREPGDGGGGGDLML